MGTNERLTAYYETLDLQLVDDYNRQHQDDPLSPIFLKTNADYDNADIKLLVFGQETYGWYKWTNLAAAQEAYEEFCLSGACFERYASRVPFWFAAKTILDDIKATLAPKAVSFLWNNLVKCSYEDVKKGYPEYYATNLEPIFSECIRNEISILKPDICIFFTGPDYDGFLDKAFNTPARQSVPGFGERQFCSITIPNVHCAIRTYHPGYLSRQGVSTRDRYYACAEKMLVEACKDL
jgi:hypothetical protein